jgi:hypothetical protein
MPVLLPTDGAAPQLAAMCAGWIKCQQNNSQRPTSPLTNLPLEHLTLTPNLAVRKMLASMQ